MNYFCWPKSIYRRKIYFRWWWELLRGSLLLTGMLFAVSASSQTADEVQPAVFDLVSINPLTGDVTIQWQPSSSGSVVAYVIQEEKTAGQSYPIVTVPKTSPPYSYSFSYPKVLTEPVSFNIVAVDSTGKESIRTNPSHTTVYVKAEYDTCQSAIKVSWTPYVGWSSNLSDYYIFSEDNFVFNLVGHVDPSVNTLVLPNVDENKTYCFYISAVRNDGAASLSNNSCITTTMPSEPGYILGDQTQYSGTRNVNLQFSTDPAVTKGSYQLLRSRDQGSTWTSLADLAVGSSQLTYTDPLPGLSVYQYKLSYLDICEAEKSSSIPINNMVLTGTSKNLNNVLTWNNFETWPNGTTSQEVYRINDGQSTLLATLSGSETSYTDVIDPQAQLSGDICYMIIATSATDQLGKVNVSQSNTFCMGLLGDIFIPNAFTPNGDGMNDEFKPGFSLIPSKYTFMVYDRYGFKIFETSDPEKGWNGKLSGGSKALEGGYIYYIRLESSTGKVLEKRGSFTLIYP